MTTNDRYLGSTTAGKVARLQPSAPSAPNADRYLFLRSKAYRRAQDEIGTVELHAVFPQDENWSSDQDAFADLDAAIDLAMAQVAPAPIEAQNIRDGSPYDNPAFQALCREHGIWGTPQSALCAVFWRAASVQLQPTDQREKFEAFMLTREAPSSMRHKLAMRDGVEYVHPQVARHWYTWRQAIKGVQPVQPAGPAATVIFENGSTFVDWHVNLAEGRHNLYLSSATQPQQCFISETTEGITP